MSTHLSDEDQILLYYNEPEAGSALRAHRDSCPACREAAEALARVLDSCNSWEVPEPDAALATRVGASLPAPVIALRSWLYTAAAVAAVLLLAFVAGRYSKRPQPSVFAGLSPQAQHRILEISLADHLDRAELFLTEVSNSSDADPIDQTRARDLVEEGRLIRQSLAREGQSATLGLMDEVERVMLEASHSSDPAGLRSLREQISSDSLLFKLRIIEANLRTQGRKS